MRTVIVTGGRDYKDVRCLEGVLDMLQPISLLRHGACPSGADAMADTWARKRGVRVDAMPADWKQYGSSAGPRRNREMALKEADVCVAFPGGRGTANMIREARLHGIHVIQVTPSGEVKQ